MKSVGVTGVQMVKWVGEVEHRAWEGGDVAMSHATGQYRMVWKLLPACLSLEQEAPVQQQGDIHLGKSIRGETPCSKALCLP